MAIPDKHVPLIASIGVIIVALFVGRQQVYGAYVRDVQALHQEMDDLQRQAEHRDEIALIEQQLAGVARRLPAEVSQDWMVKHLAQLAEQAGVTFDTMRPQTPTVADALTRYAVELSLHGTYHQIGDLVNRIHASTPFLAVERLNMVKERSTPEQEDAAGATARVQMTVFTVAPRG